MVIVSEIMLMIEFVFVVILGCFRVHVSYHVKRVIFLSLVYEELYNFCMSWCEGACAHA